MIADLFHGCLDVQNFHEHILFPARLLQEQMDYLHSISEVFHERGLCTSGITLEFSTPQPVISFRCSVCAYSRSRNSIDIYEDGVLTETTAFDIDHGISEITYTRRKKGSSTLRIYFPAMASLRILEPNLGDARPVPKRAKTLLCLGDSITQGIFCQTASMTYPAQLGRAWNLEVFNQGIGGFYYDSRFLAPVHADYVTVAYGTNDYTHYGDPELVRSHAREFCETLGRLFPDARIAVISPTWRADLLKKADEERFGEICGSILETAAHFGYETVAGSDLINHSAEFFTDGYLHPNDSGFGQYAERLIKRLEGVWGFR